MNKLVLVTELVQGLNTTPEEKRAVQDRLDDVVAVELYEASSNLVLFNIYCQRWNNVNAITIGLLHKELKKYQLDLWMESGSLLCYAIAAVGMLINGQWWPGVIHSILLVLFCVLRQVLRNRPKIYVGSFVALFLLTIVIDGVLLFLSHKALISQLTATDLTAYYGFSVHMLVYVLRLIKQLFEI